MTQVTSFGTPAMVRATSGSVTGSWGSGQSRTAGNQLVAVVTAGGSTASAAAISTPSGWTQQVVTSNVATTAYAWVAVYTKTAAGSDSAPAFTATLSGTVAMTVTLFELAAAANLNPVDTYGTYASGGTAGTLTLTATTSGNVSVAGEFAIACFCMERAAATNTWTHGSGWTNAANDGTTNTVLHTAVDYYASPSAGSTLAETGSWTTETTAYGAGIILTVAPQLGGIELYANDASTTISSGGTDAPASGTPEFLTAASWSSFPAASNTTTPPTKFHGADPAAPSELFEILNTSTGLAVRGAQGTTPVTHSGGFTLQQVIPAGNQQPRVYNVRDPRFGATGNGSADDTAAIQAAWIAAVGSGSGVVYIPSGNYKTSSTVGGNLNGSGVTIWADPGAVIYYYGSGDCIRMYDSSDYTGWRGSDWRSGIFGFLSIDGSNSSASVASAGVHAGDILGLGVYCSVREFSQHAGSIGIWFDNNFTWTEQMHGRVHVAANSTNVIFDNSANPTGNATGSFYRAIVDIFVENDGVGDGVTVTDGAILLDSRIGIYGNFSTSATQYAVLKVTGNNDDNRSTILNSVLNIGVELDDNADLAPYTIYQGTAAGGDTTITGCSGVLDFSGGYPFTPTNFNLTNPDIAFIGMIMGDANLAPLGEYAVPTSTNALYLLNQGLAEAEQWGIQVSTHTIDVTSTSTLYQLFNWSTDGAITLTVGEYFFETTFNLTGMSGTSGTFSFGFNGTASAQDILYTAFAQKAAGGEGAALMTTSTTASATVLVAATTSTAGQATIKGTFAISSGGTVIPAVAFSQTASAVIVNIGSYFRIWQVATADSTPYIGNWS